MPTLDSRWLQRRQRLHERYVELHRMPDPSRLAYLRGPEQSLTEDQVADLWRRTAAASMPGVLQPVNHVYLHVPFCKSICSFCNYERLRPSRPELMERWQQRVLASIDRLASSVSSLTFSSIYIGGGTPSTLPAARMDAVLNALHSKLNFADNASRAVEFDPAVASEAKIDVLTKHGFSRFSFGIQTLDPEVNRAHNRGPQGPQTIDRFFGMMKKRGHQSVSCDFLIGLAGTTPTSILHDIEQVLANHQPRDVDIFSLVPTESYLAGHFDGSADAFWAHMKPFQEQIPGGLERLAARYDYRLTGGGHRFLLKRQHRRRVGAPKGPSYQQLVNEVGRPLNLLGFGTSARSQLFMAGAIQYRDPDEDVGTEGPAWYRGHLLDPEMEGRNYLIHQLRDSGSLDFGTYQAIFGADLRTQKGPMLAAWKQLGLATMTDTEVRLTPSDIRERGAALLWSVPERWLELEIARVLGLDLSTTGISQMFQRLPEGQSLGNGVTYQGTHNGLIQLGGTARSTLRVTPPLTNGDRVSLAVESRELGADIAALKGALRKLHGFLARTVPRPRGGQAR